MASIHFLDVTNRDGVQTARTGLSKFGKVMVNFYLGRLGVAQSEIGFPFLFHEAPYVRACLALAEAGAFGGLRLSGWCRAVAADVEAAASAVPQPGPGARGLRHYNLSISTSDQMIAHKFRGRLDREAIIAEMTAAVAVAREAGAETVGVNAEDGSRTDDGYLLEFALAAREAGACRVRYCDTTGGDSPGRIRERFAALASAAGLPVETHCHNDLGMAVANSVSGALGDLDAGQDAWVNTCVNGIGERAGNAALEEIVMALHTRRNHYGIETGIDTTKIYRTSRLISAISGVPVQPNKAVVGDNAFAHEAGIHQHGVLMNRATYEIMTPETVGIPSNKLVLGKHSGRHAIKKHLEDNGVRLTQDELQRVFQEFKALCDKKKQVTIEDVLSLVEAELRTAPQTFALRAFHVSTSSTLPPMASVTLVRGQELFTQEASGDGPVDAIYNAINAIVGLTPTLADYAIKAITGGTDAMGEATVKVRDGDGLFVGRGTSTDVLEASARAYLVAVNKIIYERQHWMSNIYG